jgi:hypothetical protein
VIVLFGFLAGAALGGSAGSLAALFYADLDGLDALTWLIVGAFIGTAIGAVVAA